MMTNKINAIFVGVDVGSSHTKVALLDAEKNLRGHAVERSGTDFTSIAEFCLDKALEMESLSRDQIAYTMSTGYGRKNVAFSNGAKTEISCHSKGCYHAFPQAMTIIDIGGQDNKVIKLDDQGSRVSFKMNRKCAAGTGAFLEEMSTRLNIPYEEMDSLARQSTDMVELGSYCTVFSATEVLEKIKQGKKAPDIVKGLFYSVIKRVMEMDTLTETVVMTGGVVAINSYLVDMLSDITSANILTAAYPQLTGAVGAALFAIENGK